MDPLQLIYWRQFVVAGGRPTILEWRSLEESDQACLAEAGRQIAAERIAAAALAAKDDEFLGGLFDLADGGAEIEEEVRGQAALTVARRMWDGIKARQPGKPEAGIFRRPSAPK